MLHQRYKDVAFLLISKATLPNYWLRRCLNSVRSPNGHPLHLHLGCGPKYLPGFINIDANPARKLDLWLDVRCGLPYRDASVDSIYSTHMVEHFFPDELQRFFCECARVLKPGGGMRLVVPSLRNAITAYYQNRSEWFYSYPSQFDSLGGRFSNFVFCDGQHRASLDFSYLEEELRKAGFPQVEESAEGKSRLYGENVPAFEPGDAKDLPHSLYVEAFN
ncbi:MAG TPA: methyltransferase domain-containing protein [Terriglobales bacterium]|nr:methyltransferase domain-containing protein [Terriglobales bacterium]